MSCKLQHLGPHFDLRVMNNGFGPLLETGWQRLLGALCWLEVTDFLARPLLICNVQFPVFLQASHSSTLRSYSATSCFTHTVELILKCGQNLNILAFVYQSF